MDSTGARTFGRASSGTEFSVAESASIVEIRDGAKSVAEISPEFVAASCSRTLLFVRLDDGND